MKNSILFIHPPAVKACEPPAGVARLQGALRHHGVSCRVWDANLEGQLRLIGEDRSEAEMADTWTRRATRHLPENLSALRSPDLYRNPDRYRRAVKDVNRLLAAAGEPCGVRLSLADYEDERLSPVRSGDLIQAAALPERNPFYRWFRTRLPEVMSETTVTHVGFSLNYLSQALTAFAMIGLLREMFPETPILLGGGLVTSWMRRPGWKSPFGSLVDEMVAGPGELPLLTLLGARYDGGPDRPSLEGFPLGDYLSPGTALPYSASGGCWWRRCSFCPERAEGNPYLPVPPSRVAADLRALVAETGPALIHLLDSALSPSLLDSMTVNPPGAPWYGFARIMPCLADRGFCLKLRDSGCVMLKLGLESGDQGVLDALNKGIDLSTASAALKNLKAAGIATYVYLLFGTPAENREAALRTLAFTVEHAELIDYLNLAIFNLPAWGPEGERLDTGEFYEGDLSLYRPFIHPEGWSRAETRRFLEREFKRHPAIAPILRRDPPFFTSNHAPFLTIESRDPV
ncbi:MAG: radical SAM protein [Deltaproteobacteria bacterium]|nr:radical SAM protein [Deltaproteobacteria bacterium]